MLSLPKTAVLLPFPSARAPIIISLEPVVEFGLINVPIKVACQGTGTGWQELIGRAIGGTTIGSPIPHSLTNNVDSLALLVRDNATSEFTLATGVVPNVVTLEADYTTGGFITVDAQCTALITQDSTETNADFSNDGKFLNDNFSSSTLTILATA